MINKKKIVIVGATSSIAQHCARIWAQEDTVDFVLVGRNVAKLENIARDLMVRSPNSSIIVREEDFLSPIAISALVRSIASAGAIDIALIAHGNLPNQNACQEDLVKNKEALLVNGVSPVLFAEAFADEMLKHNTGTLAVIGSVAGDRGRKSNYVYGAAKGLVDRYIQGLQHRLARTGVNAVLIKPGPTDTPMTTDLGMKKDSLANPKEVASDIVAGINKGRIVVYTPKKWGLIMLIIRHIPVALFKYLNI